MVYPSSAAKLEGQTKKRASKRTPQAEEQDEPKHLQVPSTDLVVGTVVAPCKLFVRVYSGGRLLQEIRDPLH